MIQVKHNGVWCDVLSVMDIVDKDRHLDMFEERGDVDDGTGRDVGVPINADDLNEIELG